MGEVNLAAIGEYEELTERFRFMSQQKEDLERSIADLQQTIVKLNRICRLRFKESFDAINEKFEAIFPRLFRGGKAKLGADRRERLSRNRRRHHRAAAGQKAAIDYACFRAAKRR